MFSLSYLNAEIGGHQFKDQKLSDVAGICQSIQRYIRNVYMLQRRVNIQKLSAQQERMLEGFVLVRARHSDPLWAADRPNAEMRNGLVIKASLFGDSFLVLSYGTYLQIVILGSIESYLKYCVCYPFP